MSRSRTTTPPPARRPRYISSTANLAKIDNPDDMTAEEFKTVVDFLIEQKKQGPVPRHLVVVPAGGRSHRQQGSLRHRLLGADGVRGEEPRASMPSMPIPRRAISCGRWRHIWSRTRTAAPSRPKAAYALLDFMLGGWYGAKITAPARLHDQHRCARLRQGPSRRVPRRGGARRSPTSPPTCAGNSRRAAPGRTAGRRRSTSTSRSGRASRPPEPELGQSVGPARSCAGRSCCLPIAFLASPSCSVPLGLTIAVSFWERAGLLVRPAFVFTSYAPSSTGVRLAGARAQLARLVEATALSLLHRLSDRLFPCLQGCGRSATRIVLLLFTVPVPGQLHHPHLRLDLTCSAAPVRSIRCSLPPG